MKSKWYEFQREEGKKNDARARAFLAEHGIAYPRCGYHIGAGWAPVVEATLTALIKTGWDKDLHQVKQKFCGLRIYTGPLTDEQQALIRVAENACAAMCEQCGALHGLEIPRVGTALCAACRDKQNRLLAEDE